MPILPVNAQVPRIVEVDPREGAELGRLRVAMEGAAIALAEGCVRHYYPKPGATDAAALTLCERCGVMERPGVLLTHKPYCPAGDVLAYVAAVNEARMGADRQREVRSLVGPRELHINHKVRGLVDHAEAAAAHAAEAAFPLEPVIADAPKVPLTFRAFQKLNALRSSTAFGDRDWTLNDWGVALAGEVGELCNLLKKNRRGLATDERFDLNGPYRELALHNVLCELADVMTYADLMITQLGAETDVVIMEKFDAVSRRIGYEAPVGVSR